MKVPSARPGASQEPNGEIVVVGTESGFDSNFNFFQDFVLASVNKNGSVNTSFGTDGQVVTGFGPNTPASAAGLAIGPDGKIVMAGTANDPTTFENEFALARYNTNGKLDVSFGTGGEVTTSFGPGTSSDAASVVIQSDGAILVAGTVEVFTIGFAEDFGLVRYNTNGSLDQGPCMTHGFSPMALCALRASAVSNPRRAKCTVVTIGIILKPD